MMLRKFLNNEIIFYNKQEKNFSKRLLPVIIIVFFILIDIVGAVYSISFFANLWKFIIIEFVFIVALLNPLTGIYIVLLTVPLEFTEVWFKYHIIKLYRLAILSVFFSWRIRKIIYRDFKFFRYLKSKISIFLLVFIVWNIITLFYSVLWKDGVEDVIRLLFYFIFYIICMDVVKDKKNIFHFFTIIVFMGYITLSLGLYEKISGNSIYYPIGFERSASTFFDPNMFGRYMAIFAIILGALILYGKKVKKITSLFYMLGILFSLTVILFAKSRSSLLALIIGYVMLILFHKKRKRLFLFFAVFLILGYIFLPLQYRNRINSIVNFKVNKIRYEGNMGRIALEKTGLEIIKRHPAFGVGLGSFPVYFLKYNKLPYYSIKSHDFLTRIFAELGVIGFLIALYIIFSILLEAYKGIKNKMPDGNLLYIKISLFSVLISIFIHAIFYSDFFYYFYTWFFIFILFKVKDLDSVK